MERDGIYGATVDITEPRVTINGLWNSIVWKLGEMWGMRKGMEHTMEGLYLKAKQDRNEGITELCGNKRKFCVILVCVYNAEWVLKVGEKF